jgi:hypothetical protein
MMLDHQSLYQSTLHRDRENIEFWTLPLLESAADRRRRESARSRAIAFALGCGLTFLVILALAALI